MKIIGDVHQKIVDYFEIIQNEDKTICVGDFGFSDEHNFHAKNISPKHKINFGNHDNTEFLNFPHSCGNFGNHYGIFTIRGAKSIDAHLRYAGVNFWHNEELSYTEGLSLIDQYTKELPNIVVSHDCPEIVRQSMFNIFDKTFTSVLLETLFEIHQPDLWIFGHHHQSKQVQINGTKFICLSELEVFVI